MTEVIHANFAGEIEMATEMWRTPVGSSFKETANLKEKEITDRLKEHGSTILTINSSCISKRRYKRRLAKALRRQEKRLG